MFSTDRDDQDGSQALRVFQKGTCCSYIKGLGETCSPMWSLCKVELRIRAKASKRKEKRSHCTRKSAEEAEATVQPMHCAIVARHSQGATPPSHREDHSPTTPQPATDTFSAAVNSCAGSHRRAHSRSLHGTNTHGSRKTWDLIRQRSQARAKPGWG